MERHGYGANCRIVTNMRVTDPELRTEKTAAQEVDDKLENIPYGGAVAYEDPIAYNFKLTNTGNTKLYNLTFEDKDIGVTLDYINGLQVTGTYQDKNVNGYFVLDQSGGTLEAKDLTADVDGYQYVGEGNGAYSKTDDGQYVKTEGGAYKRSIVSDIAFKDNQALIAFLKTLSTSVPPPEQTPTHLVTALCEAVPIIVFTSPVTLFTISGQAMSCIWTCR